MSEERGKDEVIDAEATLAGRNLIVIGCTGFLGKVWLSLLLDRYPGIGKLYTLVRAKKNLSPEERFWTEIAPSPVFDSMRERYGAGYDDFLREHIVPIGGDVSSINLGIDDDIRETMKGTVDVIVNVAGVVDFNPPLDEALKVNAFGAQNVVALARELGDIRIMHTSTCYVVGRRDGLTPERSPLEFPFPRADELDVSHWNAENEIAECVDVVEHTRRRVEDAPRQSHLLDEAKQNLKRKHEPLRGTALQDELDRVKKKYVRQKLIEAGKERALFWGWSNIYTYTKSIGEQVFLSSGLDVTLVRPAIIESAFQYPVPGWCEGVNTSSPIMYLAYAGHQMIPCGDHCHYDAVPVDICAAGMIAALCVLLRGEHEPVYQLCTSDVNPLRTRRAGELIGLAKRRYYREKSGGNAIVNALQAHSEPAIVHVDTYRKWSSPAVARRAKNVSKALGWAKETPLGPWAGPAKKQVDGYARLADNVSKVFDEFIPFITANEFRFSAKNTRAAWGRLSDADKEKLPWNPEEIDWRHYWLDIHHPGVEKWSLPVLRDRLAKEAKPLRRHDDLIALLEDMAERHEHALAMQRLEGEQLTRFTYRDVERLSAAVAARLWEAGIRPGDRVVLGGQNHPAWGIAYFGIVRCGAAAVPIDKDYDATPLRRVLEVSEAKIAIFDESVAALDDMPIPRWDLVECAEGDMNAQAPEVEIDPDALASILYTSGTTGDPKGVMLSHENFTALIASLATLFPIGTRDRLLSVLPLHHTFEFTCGLLLPLSRGARVVYLDEVNGDRLGEGLREGQISAMVGVPALWELIERRISTEVRDRGKLAERTYDILLDFNRNMGKSVGFDLGKVLFAPIHEQLGGNLRFMISGAAALSPEVHKTFQGLGLHLAEGYGLTEAAPVLTVAKGSARSKAGTVGRAIPGVEIKIDKPNDEGVGEILARGPNVMKGYAGDDEATAQTLDDGWLRTGDLGKLDHKDRLRIVGRSKEVIIASSGENVYPDDVEKLVGLPKYIKELSIVGVPDPSGGERVACLAVPEQVGEELERAELHKRANDGLRRVFDEKLTRAQRPAILQLTDIDLPRTATRKVKRKDVVAFIERVRKNAENARRQRDEGGSSIVRNAIAGLAKRDPKDIRAEHDLAADLGFDSLTSVELLTTLEATIPGAPVEQLQTARTVGEIEALLEDRDEVRRTKSRSAKIERDEDEEVDIPDFLVDPAKKALTAGQMAFYDKYMQVKVRGKANIPQNTQTLVVANHASHLDMGLCKYALGAYGDGIVALAAEDYFFEGRWRRTYFDKFTNMAPLDRKSSLRKAMQQAGEHLDRGRTVLIFPEGTRSTDGIMREFMPLIGHLSLSHNVTILPMWLDGTHKAFPKGIKVPIPRRRKVGVRIGPALHVSDLRRETEGLKRSDAYRKVAQLAHQAVEALRDGGQLDLSRPELVAAQAESADKGGFAALFEDLQGRFVTGAVDKPTSFYFSLGDAADGKWTLEMDPEKCSFRPGRPEGGKADCVLKTSSEIFTKIVRESYTPSVAEFMAGKVKSNDIGLLQVFQKAFAL